MPWLPPLPTGNFLLANPVSGSPIVTGVAVQQGKIILTATFPTSMLVSQVLPPAPSLALPAGTPHPQPHAVWSRAGSLLSVGLGVLLEAASGM